jgi:photosystem II stability/assembly factor-like uncharacterized protein
MRKVKAFHHSINLSLRFSILFLLAFTVTAVSLYGADKTWIGNGPGGGSINTLVIDPNMPKTIYAGTENGVFKSTDGGRRWNAAEDIRGIGVYSLAINPKNSETIYSGTRKGVYKSTDRGIHWTAVSADLNLTNVFVLTIDPESTDTIYAGTVEGGVFKSTNGGNNWSAVSHDFDRRYIRAMAIDPGNPNTIYASTPSAVYKSTDGAQSWNLIQKSLGENSIGGLVIDPKSPQTIYATALNMDKDGGIFRSVDGGNSWTKIPMDLRRLSGIQVLAVAPDALTMYAAHDEIVAQITSGNVIRKRSEWPGGIYRSTDGGQNWEAVDTSGISADSISALVVDPGNAQILYVGTNNGVFISSDGGNSWTDSNEGFVNATISALALGRGTQTIYAGTDKRIYKSTDGGQRWTATDTGLPSSPIHSLATSPGAQTVFAANEEGLFRSTDGGGSWDKVRLGHREEMIGKVVFIQDSPQTVYAATSYGSHGYWYRSNDGGKSWNSILNVFVNGPSAPAVDPENPQILYAGFGCNTLGWPGGVYKSTDGGKSWMEINTGLSETNVCSIAIDPVQTQTLYAGIYGIIEGPTFDPGPDTIIHGGIFKSTDGGNSWVEIHTGPTRLMVNVLAIDPKSPETMYAGTSSGLYKSTDRGNHWAAVRSGLPTSSIRALAIDPDTQSVYVGTSCCGVFRIKDPASE